MVSALYTTSPLDRYTWNPNPSTSSTPFSASPISDCPISPTCVPRRANTVYHSEPLTFRKIAIPSNCTSPVASSTESEALSDGAQISRSPSLLTSLFMTQSQVQQSRSMSSSRQTSSSASSQPTPTTPISSNRYTLGQPILRRDTSASTSPSEDCLGLSAWKPLTYTEGEDKPTLHSRRSCLKFAVNSLSVHTGSAPFVRGRTMVCKSPAPIPVWADIPCPLPVEIEDESDEDEGYVEDEEDGFDSGEEEGYVGTFASVPGTRWESRFPGFCQFDKTQSSRPHPADIDDLGSSPEATPTRPIAPKRQTSIAISQTCNDPKSKCSRHISPPPPEFLTVMEPAPPAARSPSAAEFCRRKASGVGREGKQPACLTLGRANTSREVSTKGWKSDDSGVPFLASQVRKASLPDNKPMGILRCTPCA